MGPRIYYRQRSSALKGDANISAIWHCHRFWNLPWGVGEHMMTLWNVSWLIITCFLTLHASQISYKWDTVYLAACLDMSECISSAVNIWKGVKHNVNVWTKAWKRIFSTSFVSGVAEYEEINWVSSRQQSHLFLKRQILNKSQSQVIYS